MLPGLDHIAASVEKRDWQDVARRLSRAWCIRVCAAKVKDLMEKSEFWPATRSYGMKCLADEDTVRMWYKARFSLIIDRTAEDEPASPCLREYRSATLHVFFITLEETEDMLARLPEVRREEPSVARSKIADTNQIIHPIDATSAKVTTNR